MTGHVPDLLAGLCTVSFRQLTPEQVLDAAVASGVEALEWAGDCHVPHGDLAAAERASALSADAGIPVVSYGSYLFLDDRMEEQLHAVLDTAVALGAPGVRVWCPFGLDPSATDAERLVVTRAAARAATAAIDRDLVLTLEFHGGTLTADARSTRRLLDDVGSPALFSGWQPPYWSPLSVSEECAALALLAPLLSHVHVYEWDPDLTRHPLARAEDTWSRRLVASGAAGPGAVGRLAVEVPRAALIEFVPDDDPDRLPAEMATLRRCLAAPGRPPVNGP